jgi:hypothetical protein
MKILTLISLLCLCAPPGHAQRSVTEYTSAQRAALQKFIEAHPEYQFIPETWFEADTLAAARNEWGFGKRFRPYYQTGDFNGDRLPDFAVILLTGKDASDPKSGMHVVIFNGIRSGGYRVAHVEREDFSPALFIQTAGKRLWVGIMETDSSGCFIPAGRGYIIEPCEP